MPTPGQCIGAAVNADGRSVDLTFYSMAAGGTYLYDASSSTGLVDRSTAKLVLTVVSKGFDNTGSATTITRTVYGVIRQRVAGTSGAAETASGGDLIITFGLDSPIYAKDTTGAGNSGTAPTLTLLGGLYTKTGVPTLAISNLAVTNSSALAYYKPSGQWMTRPNQRMTADFTLAFSPQYLHGIDAIACVRFDVDGQTSSVNANATTTTPTKRQRAGTGLYSDEFVSGTITLSTFTQGEIMKARARVYPTIGDAVFDTNDNSANLLVQCDQTFNLYCDKTLALQVYAIVDTGGNDTTGTASATLATARAAPFATIAKALIAGASLIYLKNQVHTFATPASTPTNFGYYQEITADPTDLGGTLAIGTGYPTYKASYLKITGLTVKLLASTSLFVATNNYFWMESCVANDNSQTLAGPLADDAVATFIDNCTGFDPARWFWKRSGADKIRLSFDGVDFGTSSSAASMNCIWRMIACKVAGAVTIQGLYPASGTAVPANVLVKHNQFTSMNNVSQTWDYAVTTSYVSIIGNLIETLSPAGSSAFQIASSNSVNMDSCIVSHNTIVGERSIVAYNDSGSAAAYRRGWAMVGNIFGGYYNKSDLYAPANAARVGNWWEHFGTLCYANVIRYTDVAGDYDGLGTLGSPQDPLFTDDRSGYSSGTYHYNANSGTGGGTYTLTAGSPAFRLLPANTRHTITTLDGVTVPNNGTADAGAYQYDHAAPTYDGAEIQPAGTSIYVAFIETVSPPLLSAAPVTGFTLTASGGAVTLSNVVITSTNLTADLSRVITSNETVTISYTPGNVTDSVGNAMAAFTNQAVLNSSEQAPSTGLPPPAPVVPQVGSRLTIGVDGQTNVVCGPVVVPEGGVVRRLGDGGGVSTAGPKFGCQEFVRVRNDNLG